MITKVLLTDLRYHKDIRRLKDILGERNIKTQEILHEDGYAADGAECTTGFVEIDHYNYMDLKEAILIMEDAGFSPITPSETEIA